MKIQDLPVATIKKLHEQVTLPTQRLLNQLTDSRKLASTTRVAIDADSLLPQQRDKYLLSFVQKEILPRYRAFLDIYRQHRSDFLTLFSHDDVGLEKEIEDSLNKPSTKLFDGDPKLVTIFMREINQVANQVSSRLRELTY
jgi:hypothetical protein